MTASCNCKFNDISNNNIIKENALFEGVVGEVFDILSASNILVVKCYDYIFKHFTESIGGFISIVSIVGHIISTSIYLIAGKLYIKKYIFNIYEKFMSFIGKLGAKNAPPKKSIKNEKLKDRLLKNKNSVHFNQSIKENQRTNSPKLNNKSDINKRKIRIDKPPNSIYDIKSTFNEIILYRETEEKLKQNKGKNLLEEKSNNLSKTKKKLKYKDIDSTMRMKSHSREINNTNVKEDDYQKFFDEYLATSLDDMEYDDAYIKDKRTFCEYFIECLKEKQMIAYTFIANDPLKIRIIKIMLFILNVMLYFVVTGLFFSEEYISELYNLDEEDDTFFSYIPRSIDKFIYTTMVSIIIGYFVDCFFIDEKKIKGIFRREKDNLINLREQILGLIKEVQNRYLTFIIIIFVILFISFYYLLCFNYVYPKTQIEWIKASLTIFVIMQMLSILKCFFKTCLRFLSFRCRSEKLFKISKLLD
jgi:hypothetical protein